MRCKAITVSGKQCSRDAVEGCDGYCRAHFNQTIAASFVEPMQGTVDENDQPFDSVSSHVDEVIRMAKKRGYSFFGGLCAILLVISLICFFMPVEQREKAWLIVLAAMIVALAMIGKAITGLWRGILIDSRNKMSLSRLQLLSWTLVVFSGLLVAAVFNARSESDSPLNIVVPDQLWIVMGLATTSAVAAPVILMSRSRQQATKEQVNEAAASMAEQTARRAAVETSNVDTVDVVDKSNRSVVVAYKKPEQAKWSDLFLGEEVGNAASVDTGKTQLFLLTFILIISYGTAIYVMLRDGDTFVGSLPPVQEGLNVLLGISQTGYLATKSIAHTPPAADPKPQPNNA